LSGAALRRLPCIVPQALAVYTTFTARENLLFFARALGLRGAKARQAAIATNGGANAQVVVQQGGGGLLADKISVDDADNDGSPNHADDDNDGVPASRTLVIIPRAPATRSR